MIPNPSIVEQHQNQQQQQQKPSDAKTAASSQSQPNVGQLDLVLNISNDGAAIEERSAHVQIGNFTWFIEAKFPVVNADDGGDQDGEEDEDKTMEQVDDQKGVVVGISGEQMPLAAAAAASSQSQQTQTRRHPFHLSIHCIGPELESEKQQQLYYCMAKIEYKLRGQAAGQTVPLLLPNHGRGKCRRHFITSSMDKLLKFRIGNVELLEQLTATVKVTVDKAITKSLPPLDTPLLLNGKQIYVNKYALAAHSTYFEHMFFFAKKLHVFS